MKILKQILSTGLLSVFLMTNFTYSFSEIQLPNVGQPLSYEKYEVLLLKTKNGEKYINLINNFIFDLRKEGNLKKLNLLLNKIDNFIIKLDNIYNLNKTKKIYNTIILIKYLKEKIIFIISDIELNNKLELEKSLEQKKEINNKITVEEQQKVEQEIIKLQGILFNNSVSYIQDYIKIFEKYSNYEESGNIDTSLNISHKDIGDFRGKLGLHNYKLKSSNFDSQFIGDIISSIHGEMKGKEKFDLDLSMFIDFISKDGGLYMLLNNLDIKSSGDNRDIAQLKELIQGFTNNGSYISFGDKNTMKAMSLLKNMNPVNFIKNGTKIISKPLFEAIEKKGDRYILIPTKYSCDKMIELMSPFNPFMPKTCSKEMYSSMIEEFSSDIKLYIILGEEPQLGFYNTDTRSIESMGFVTYDDNKILEINANIIPNQDKNIGEGFDFSYKVGEKIYGKLYADEGNIEITLNGDFDKDNKVKFVNLIGKINNKHYYGGSDNQSFDLKFENRKITGNYLFELIGEDKNKDYELKGTLNGTTDSKNNILSLGIELDGKDYNNPENFVDINLDYKLGRFNLGFDVEKKSGGINLDFSGKYNSKRKVLDNFKFKAIGKYYSYYTEESYELFNSELRLSNDELTGKTIISDRNGKLIEIKHSGEYKKDYLEFNNHYKLSKNPFVFGNKESYRNAKRISDINSLLGLLNVNLTEGMNLNDMFIGNKLNFINLNINREDFLDPNGEDYMIFHKGNKYQILAKLEKNGNIVAKIVGNYGYFNSEEGSLVVIDGKQIKDGDILGKIKNNKTSTIISGDLDLLFDLRRDKYKTNIYFDMKENIDKIIDFNFDADVKVKYKKQKIEKPEKIMFLEDTLYYGNQIKKARDSSRIMDIRALQSALEQSYYDFGEYPTKENFIKNILDVGYMLKLPKDIKDGEIINGCKFGYIYEVGDDDGIENQTYKLSTCFESSSNINSKAKTDGGIYDNRLEIGNNLSGKYNEKFYLSELVK